MIDFSLDEDQEAMVALARDFGRRQMGDAELAVDRMPDPVVRSPAPSTATPWLPRSSSESTS